jgi:hypothetical protein
MDDQPNLSDTRPGKEFDADSLRSQVPSPIIADTQNWLKESSTVIDAESLHTAGPSPICADTRKLSCTFDGVANPLPGAWPNNLLEQIRSVIERAHDQPPQSPEFKFELSRNAAVHNAKILQKYNLRLGDALAANGSSPLGYGSEFRSVKILQSIFSHHPNWARLHSLLTNGSSWPLAALDEKY